MRNAIYARVTTIQGEQDKAIETQVSICRAAAVEAGYAVPVDLEFREHGSGATLERLALNDLRRSIRDREIQELFVYALDRLSRNPVDLMVILQECEVNDVSLHVVHGPQIQNPDQTTWKTVI